ncbi:hypothetical protein BC830DRAFT_54915 [Chytriomyces sp. MP71]|nr:hypothetical protein BC830DRAFT_54915 [Chytriomyces sp. MP71]
MSVQDHTLRSLASLHRSVHARAAASAGDEYARLVSQGSVSRDAPVSGPTAHALVRGLWSALLKSSSSAEDQQGENENELDGQPSLVASAAAHTLVSLSLGRACLDPRKLALAFSALLANDHLIYNNNIVAVVVRAIAQLSLAIAAPETSPQLNLASRNPLAIALANALSLHVSSAIVVEACALLDTLELSSSSDGLTNLNHAAILATVVPVIALISAPETPPSVATALARRSATLVASSEPSLEARTVIASTLLRVVASMPPMMDAPFDLDAYAILETVLSFSAAYPDTNMHQQVVITILVFLVDSNIHRASILAYLNLFRKYVKTSVLSPALLTVTFVSFLHLLFSGSDLDRERIGIINILDSLFEPGPLVVPCAIVAAAVFPLTSLVSELPAKGNATLRKSAFLLLERVRTRLLTHKKDFTDSDVNEITVEQVFLTVSTYSSGFLISVIAQTIAFLDAWRNAKLALTFASQPSTLTPLLAPSFLLHPSESICLSAVTKLSSLVTSFTASSNSGTTSLPSTQLALPLLPFLLHLLTVPNSPTMTNALLQDLLPALATDAHATAAILRALAPLVDGAGGGATRAAGLRALHGVWRAQPRAWGTLKAALGKMVGTRRERDDRRRRFGKKGDGVGDSGLGDVDVEVAVAVTVW